MARKAQKHKIYLSAEESEAVKPVRWPWLWVGLLVFAVLITFWKSYMIDTEALKKERRAIAAQELQAVPAVPSAKKEK